MAPSTGQKGIVRLLIENEADINAATKENFTALLLAVRSGMKNLKNKTLNLRRRSIAFKQDNIGGQQYFMLAEVFGGRKIYSGDNNSCQRFSKLSHVNKTTNYLITIVVLSSVI